jgi:hypothetical protein
VTSPGRRAAGSRDADIHLREAKQFLDAARSALSAENFNPAVSDSVISGINSSDVISIAETAVRHDSANHEAKIGLLRESGPLGARAAPVLDRLLPLENLAQYRTSLATRAEAEQAMNDAEALLELAIQARSQLP